MLIVELEIAEIQLLWENDALLRFKPNVLDELFGVWILWTLQLSPPSISLKIIYSGLSPSPWPIVEFVELPAYFIDLTYYM